MRYVFAYDLKSRLRSGVGLAAANKDSLLLSSHCDRAVPDRASNKFKLKTQLTVAREVLNEYADVFAGGGRHGCETGV